MNKKELKSKIEKIESLLTDLKSQLNAEKEQEIDNPESLPEILMDKDDLRAILNKEGFISTNDVGYYYDPDEIMVKPLGYGFEFNFHLGEEICWGIRDCRYNQEVYESADFESFKDCLADFRAREEDFSVRKFAANFECLVVQDNKNVNSAREWAEYIFWEEEENQVEWRDITED